MELVLKSLWMYLFLLWVFRTTGKRSIGDHTPLEFALLVMVAGASVPGVVSGERTFWATFLMGTTLLGVHTSFNWLKSRWSTMADWIDGTPLILVENGEWIDLHLRRTLTSRHEVLSYARGRGIDELDQIRYAILERNGKITIIPAR